MWAGEESGALPGGRSGLPEGGWAAKKAAGDGRTPSGRRKREGGREGEERRGRRPQGRLGALSSRRDQGEGVSDPAEKPSQRPLWKRPSDRLQALQQWRC
eukprot:10288368-Heterocapsa_arctica.AAC.1